MRNFLAPSAIVLAMGVSVAAHATSYNAVSDFSVTNGNPNGVWSYGYGTPGGAMSLDTVHGTTYSGAAWDYWSIDANGLPVVAHSVNGDGCCATANPPSNVLEMHPGNADDQASIVEFTAPTAGTYNFAGFFQRDDTADGAGTGAAVSIYDDGTLLFSSTVPEIYLTDVNFGSSVNLSANDTLAFVVARTGGNYSNDSTGLSLSISSTPEPSSIALLGTGLLSAAGFARRKFARS